MSTTTITRFLSTHGNARAWTIHFLLEGNAGNDESGL